MTTTAEPAADWRGFDDRDELEDRIAAELAADADQWSPASFTLR